MENLSGKAFSQERGHINRFLKNHEVESIIFNADDADKVQEITDGWYKKRAAEGRNSDYSATMNIIKNIETLDISGMIVYVDKLPAAVAAGFNLNYDTVDCSLQKNCMEIQGLTYYIRREYAKSRPENVRYFNWEEDLGINGLRRAKKLMQPCRMIDMYTATRIN